MGGGSEAGESRCFFFGLGGGWMLGKSRGERFWLEEGADGKMVGRPQDCLPLAGTSTGTTWY